MDSTIKELFQNKEFFKAMVTAVETEMKKMSFRQKKQLFETFCEDYNENYSDISKQQWEEAVNGAVNECWTILLSLPDRVQAVLEEALDDLAGGLCTVADLAQRVCRETVRQLIRNVADMQRDDDFAGLRKGISKCRLNGAPAFATCREGRDVCFSPVPGSHEPPQFTKAELRTPPASLGKADPGIRKLGKVATEHGDSEQMKWVWDVVAKEGRRFWQAFVDERCGGEPVFVPIYALYCWLRRDYVLGRPSAPRIRLDAPAGGEDDPEGDSTSLVDFLPSKDPSAEDGFAMEEVRGQALDFAASLSGIETAVFALHIAERQTMEQVAQALGMSGASSLTRYKTRLKDKLRERITQFDTPASQKCFVESVLEACKNRMAAPTAKTEDD